MAGIYVHIPFCTRKCRYCDFYSVTGFGDLTADFLSALTTEVYLRSKSVEDLCFDTLYIGGGTPSLLSSRELKRLLKVLNTLSTVRTEFEITIEVNPGTLSEEGLEQYREMGFNRVSIGVQSFNDDELSLLGRIHTGRVGAAIVESAQKSFSNVNIDLIFGLPGQNSQEWERTLETTAALRPQHISAYMLSWSPRTPIGKQILEGALRRPEEEVSAECYLLTHDFLTHKGYDHYEISNFAMPGYRCRHNEGYWTGSPYIGLGPSAHSFLNGKRSWNTTDIQEYIFVLSQNRLPVNGEEYPDHEQRALEKLVLNLRRKEGIPLEYLKGNGSCLESLVHDDLARLNDDVLQLTPKGFLVADEVALRLCV